jgi:hypothetical protein
MGNIVSELKDSAVKRAIETRTAIDQVKPAEVEKNDDYNAICAISIGLIVILFYLCYEIWRHDRVEEMSENYRCSVLAVENNW